MKSSNRVKSGAAIATAVVLIACQFVTTAKAAKIQIPSVSDFLSRLPHGTKKPKVNGACLGSPPTRQLGTDNVPIEDNKATTIVNIWGIKKSTSLVGYVVKTFNGKAWYVPPIPAIPQEIDPGTLDDWASAHLLFIGCFSGDLPLPPGNY